MYSNGTATNSISTTCTFHLHNLSIGMCSFHESASQVYLVQSSYSISPWISCCTVWNAYTALLLPVIVTCNQLPVDYRYAVIYFRRLTRTQIQVIPVTVSISLRPIYSATILLNVHYERPHSPWLNLRSSYIYQSSGTRLSEEKSMIFPT